MISYAIEAANESRIFDRVYVSTEDADIARIAREQNSGVLDRPLALAGDQARVVDVAVDCLDSLARNGQNYDDICVVYATAALMQAEDLQGAWELYLNKRANAAMAVTDYYEHPLWALRQNGQFMTPAFPKAMTQRQALPHYKVDVGYFYFIKTRILRERMSFYVPRLVGYPIPRLRSVDIDEPEHLQVAEALISLSSAGVK